MKNSILNRRDTCQVGHGPIVAQQHPEHSDITVVPLFNEIFVHSTWSVPSNDVKSIVVILSNDELDYYAAFDNAGDVPMSERPSPSQLSIPCALARYASTTYVPCDHDRD